MDDLSFLQDAAKGNVQLIIQPIEGPTKTLNQLDREIIMNNSPLLATMLEETSDGFTYTFHTNAPTAVVCMLRHIFIGDYTFCDAGLEMPGTLLLHLQIYQLAITYEIFTLQTTVSDYIGQETERFTETNTPMHGFYEGIRFLYTDLRDHLDIRQVIAFYCVSRFDHFNFAHSETFRQTVYQSPMFHRDLQHANSWSNFSPKGAIDIVQLPVCRHLMHEQGLDFTCHLHWDDAPVLVPYRQPPSWTRSQIQPQQAHPSTSTVDLAAQFRTTATGTMLPTLVNDINETNEAYPKLAFQRLPIIQPPTTPKRFEAFTTTDSGFRPSWAAEAAPRSVRPEDDRDYDPMAGYGAPRHVTGAAVPLERFHQKRRTFSFEDHDPDSEEDNADNDYEMAKTLKQQDLAVRMFPNQGILPKELLNTAREDISRFQLHPATNSAKLPLRIMNPDDSLGSAHAPGPSIRYPIPDRFTKQLQHRLNSLDANNPNHAVRKPQSNASHTIAPAKQEFIEESPSSPSEAGQSDWSVIDTPPTPRAASSHRQSNRTIPRSNNGDVSDSDSDWVDVMVL